MKFFNVDGGLLGQLAQSNTAAEYAPSSGNLLKIIQQRIENERADKELEMKKNQYDLMAKKFEYQIAQDKLQGERWQKTFDANEDWRDVQANHQKLERDRLKNQFKQTHDLQLKADERATATAELARQAAEREEKKYEDVARMNELIANTNIDDFTLKSEYYQHITDKAAEMGIHIDIYSDYADKAVTAWKEENSDETTPPNEMVADTIMGVFGQIASKNEAGAEKLLEKLYGDDVDVTSIEYVPGPDGNVLDSKLVVTKNGEKFPEEIIFREVASVNPTKYSQLFNAELAYNKASYQQQLMEQQAILTDNMEWFKAQIERDRELSAKLADLDYDENELIGWKGFLEDRIPAMEDMKTSEAMMLVKLVRAKMDVLTENYSVEADRKSGFATAEQAVEWATGLVTEDEKGNPKIDMGAIKDGLDVKGEPVAPVPTRSEANFEWLMSQDGFTTWLSDHKDMINEATMDLKKLSGGSEKKYQELLYRFIYNQWQKEQESRAKNMSSPFNQKGSSYDPFERQALPFRDQLGKTQTLY